MLQEILLFFPLNLRRTPVWGGKGQFTCSFTLPLTHCRISCIHLVPHDQTESILQMRKERLRSMSPAQGALAPKHWGWDQDPGLPDSKPRLFFSPGCLALSTSAI